MVRYSLFYGYRWTLDNIWKKVNNIILCGSIKIHGEELLNVRILFLNNGLAGGGVEKLLNDLLPLINQCYECELLIITEEDSKYLESLLSNHVTVNIVPKNIRGHFKKMIYIMKYIKNGEFDIVHANEFPVFYYCSIIKKIMKKGKTKFVMTEHNTDNRRRHIPLLRPIEKWIYRSYDHIISISEDTQRELISWLKCEEDINTFSVVYNGIKIDDFIDAKAYSKKKLFNGAGENDVLLGMVGSFTEQKNHLFLLEVMKDLPDNFHLLLMGEGPLENEIVKRVETLNLQKRVHFLGFRTDIPCIMKSIDILIVPSKWEGFGLIAVEALATGTPIVASEVPGLSNIIADCGYKCKVDNTREFVNAIERAVDLCSDQNFKEKCKRRAELFDICVTKNKYLTLYRRVKDENIFE